MCPLWPVPINDPAVCDLPPRCCSLSVVFMVCACGRGRQDPLPTAGYPPSYAETHSVGCAQPLGCVGAAVSLALTARLPLSPALGRQAHSLGSPVRPLPGDGVGERQVRSGAETGGKENAHRSRAPVVKAEAGKSLEEKPGSKAKWALGLQALGRWTESPHGSDPTVRQPWGASQAGAPASTRRPRPLSSP